MRSAAGRCSAATGTWACAVAGSRSPAATDLKITLHRVKWVSDAVIDGTALWDQSSGWLTARLTVHPDHGAAVGLTSRWRVFGTQRQPAVIRGSQGGRRLAAEYPAP